MELVLLEKVSVEVDFENCGEIVSLSDIEFVAQTHARVSYSIPGLIVVHFELVRLKKISMTLKHLVEMMSPTCFEIVAQFHEILSYSFLTQIFLQLDVLEGVYGV